MKTALLIIDIQNDYFEEGLMPLPNAEQACENARLVLDRFREEYLPVVFVQHIGIGPGATFFLPYTKGVQIHHHVEPLPHEKVVLKHYPNGFRETDLFGCLAFLGITDLVVCGMMTHMCIDATVRAARDFGYNCTLLGDACASMDLEIQGKVIRSDEIHDSFLAALNGYYATVLPTHTYLESKTKLL